MQDYIYNSAVKVFALYASVGQINSSSLLPKHGLRSNGNTRVTQVHP